MKIAFDQSGWEDFVYWSEADKKIFKKLKRLINETSRSPFSGIGKPEPLKGDWSGFWSRRLDQRHRLVYRIIGQGDTQTLEIVVCRYHYGN